MKKKSIVLKVYIVVLQFILCNLMVVIVIHLSKHAVIWFVVVFYCKIKVFFFGQVNFLHHSFDLAQD